MGGEANNTITVSQPDSLETGIDDPHLSIKEKELRTICQENSLKRLVANRFLELAECFIYLLKAWHSLNTFLPVLSRTRHW